MPTVKAVRAVLLHVGEQPATQRAGGFDARDLGGEFIAVRWHPPPDGRTSDAGLAFLEEYARLLRDAGIRALITTEDGDPRVVCSPGPVPGRRRGPGDSARRAG